MIELREIEKNSRAQKCIIHAKLNLEQVRATEELPSRVAQISLKNSQFNEVFHLKLVLFFNPELIFIWFCKQEDSSSLVEFWDEFKSAAGVPGKPSTIRIAKIPPHLEAIPCRPIVLDTAVNSFEFPSLKAKVKAGKKGTQGWLGGFFGSRT